MISQLYEQLAQIKIQSKACIGRQPTNDSVFNELSRILGDFAQVIHPNLLEKLNEPNNNLAAIRCIQGISYKHNKNSQRPYVAIWKNQHFQNNRKEKIASWQGFVIYPKIFKDYQNCPVKKKTETLYFIDPFHHHMKISPLFIHLLKNRIFYTLGEKDRKQEYQIGGIFPKLQFMESRRKEKIKITRKESSFSVVYQTLMLVLTGNYQSICNRNDVGIELLKILPHLCDQNSQQTSEVEYNNLDGQLNFIEQAIRLSLEEKVSNFYEGQQLKKCRLSLYYLSMLIEDQQISENFNKCLQRVMRARSQDASQCFQGMKKVGIGADKFEDLLKTHVFVDKTLLIKQFIDDATFRILITRPRRWGKTLNLLMLKFFLQIPVNENGQIQPDKNKIYFTGGEIQGIKYKRLKIAQHQNIMNQAGKWPVIYFSLSGLPQGKKNKSLIPAIKQFVRDSYQKHIYLYYHYLQVMKSQTSCEKKKDYAKQTVKIFRKYLQSKDYGTDDLSCSLKNLASMLFNYHKKQVYILVDEYDAAFNLKLGQLNQQEIKIILNMYAKVMKGCQQVKKGIMIGILPVSKSNTYSGLNNFNVHAVHDTKDSQYAKYFGFTQAQVDQLIKQTLSQSQGCDFRESIKNWYNGYSIGKQVIYNPWSIMSCLMNFHIQQQPLRQYWINSGNHALLISIFKNIQSPNLIRSLITQSQVQLSIMANLDLFDLKQHQKIFFTLLLHLGYLTKSWTQGIYRIPNIEVKLGFFEEIVQSWIQKMFVHNDNVLSIIRSLIDNLESTQKYEQIMNKQLLNSRNKIKNESDLSAVFGGIFAFVMAVIPTSAKHQTYFQVHNSQQKRLDNLFLPIEGKSETVVIHEYKFINQKNYNPQQIIEETLWQIYGKDYINVVLDHHRMQHYALIKIRAIIFFKNSYHCSQLRIQQYCHNPRQAQQISFIFQTKYDLDSKQERRQFLNDKQFASIHQLLAKFSQQVYPIIINTQFKKNLDNSMNQIRKKMKNNRDKIAKRTKTRTIEILRSTAIRNFYESSESNEKNESNESNEYNESNESNESNENDESNESSLQ